MAGEFGTGGMVTTVEEARSRSGPSFAGEKARILDIVFRMTDSNPLKKETGCLSGVGDKRLGKGSVVGYIKSVNVIGYVYQTVVTHRDLWNNWEVIIVEYYQIRRGIGKWRCSWPGFMRSW